MIELGGKSQVIGAEYWSTFRMRRRPRQMPDIPKGHTIVCGFKEAGIEGERLFICETLEQILALYDEYANDNTVHISWYHTGALNNVDV